MLLLAVTLTYSLKHTYRKEAIFNIHSTDAILLSDVELQLCQSRRGETQHHAIDY